MLTPRNRPISVSGAPRSPPPLPLCVPEAFTGQGGPPEAKQPPHRRGEESIESDESGHDDVRHADKLNGLRGRPRRALSPSATAQALLLVACCSVAVFSVAGVAFAWRSWVCRCRSNGDQGGSGGGCRSREKRRRVAYFGGRRARLMGKKWFFLKGTHARVQRTGRVSTAAAGRSLRSKILVFRSRGSETPGWGEEETTLPRFFIFAFSW